MKRTCELCSHTARIYCESDQAHLCYVCDQSIHSANFLVAKHSRSLLCHQCQSSTPWIASGLNLGRANSLCVSCLDLDSPRRRIPETQTSHRRNDSAEDDCDVGDDFEEEGDSETDDESAGDFSDEDEDEDGENQVVPWTSAATASPLTTTSTSASSSTSRDRDFSSSVWFSSSPIKRKRLDAGFDSEDDTVSSSEGFNGEGRM